MLKDKNADPTNSKIPAQPRSRSRGQHIYRFLSLRKPYRAWRDAEKAFADHRVPHVGFDLCPVALDVQDHLRREANAALLGWCDALNGAGFSLDDFLNH